MTNGDPIELELWDYAGGPANAHVLKEIKKSKASETAIGRLERAMKRLEDGTSTPQETDLVRDGIYELRVSADKRWYRLLWGRCGDRFVALIFIVKKSNRLDKNDIKTASRRLSASCGDD